MSDKSKKVHRIKEPVTLAPSEYANRLKYIYDYVAELDKELHPDTYKTCLLYTSPSPRDGLLSRMPSSA